MPTDGDYDVIVTKREPDGDRRQARITRITAHVGDGELLSDENGWPIEIEAIDYSTYKSRRTQ